MIVTREKLQKEDEKISAPTREGKEDTGDLPLREVEERSRSDIYIAVQDIFVENSSHCRIYKPKIQFEKKGYIGIVRGISKTALVAKRRAKNPKSD